ncbi:hypothetical protein EXS72_01790 [Candidatus Pacearchaeota archaeon]|nr:hypothetical protein [Candidatus Pacearchaeota archaeon]
MKLIIWIIIAVIIIGSIFLFLSSNNDEIDKSREEINERVDSLSENGRVIDSDTNVLAELDDALNTLD